MFVVVVMVCLAATGEQCQEFKFPAKEYTDVVSCITRQPGRGRRLATQEHKVHHSRHALCQDPKVPDAPND